MEEKDKENDFQNIEKIKLKNKGELFYERRC